MENITKESRNNNYYNINYNYIAGFIHADGTFTAPLIKGKNKLYINPRFILTQHIINKNLINEIKKLLNNKGHIKNQTNNIMKYSITNIEDIINIILPIFDKYQVRSNRYYSYLKFKLLVKIIYYEKPIYKSSLWLFAIILSRLINPNVKLSKQIRYLNKDEIKMIKNKKLPLDINYKYIINKYCPELNIIIDNNNNNIPINLYNNEMKIKNSQELNIDFIKGLFDGDGSLEVNLKDKGNGKYSNSIRFQIIQDIYNVSILEELINYFDVGTIRYHNTEKSVSYYCESKKLLINNIFNKGFIKNNNIIFEYKKLVNINWNIFIGPPIKSYKFYNLILIENLLINNKLNNPIILDKVINYIYNIIKNPKNLSLKEFKNNKIKLSK